MKTLQEAYDILKANARYSSSVCDGFVYLSQIRELISNEETFNLPTNQAETVQFLLMNASRLDKEHFNNLMAKLEQWKEGMNTPKYNQSLIDKVHNREAVIEVDDFAIIKDLINFMYPDDPYLEDEFPKFRLNYFSLENPFFNDNLRVGVYQKHYWGSNFSGHEEMENKPRIKASEVLL